MDSRHVFLFVVLLVYVVPALYLIWLWWPESTSNPTYIDTSMKIAGRFNDYVCDFYRVGHAYADVYVYASYQEKQWFGFKTVMRGRRVWEFSLYSQHGVPKLYDHARLAKPEEVIVWYRKAVDQYEDYLAAWTSQCENGAGTAANRATESVDDSDQCGSAPLKSSTRITQFAAGMTFIR